MFADYYEPGRKILSWLPKIVITIENAVSAYNLPFAYRVIFKRGLRDKENSYAQRSGKQLN